MLNYTMLIIIAVIMLPVFVFLAFTIIVFRRDRCGRRTPLTSSLLRGPGESLRTHIEVLSEKINDALFVVFSMCAPPIALLMVITKVQGGPVQGWQWAAITCLYVTLLAWSSRRLYRLLKERRDYYLGLDAELAVGQELNHLMLQGCRVFHDFPAESFNVDHVVVGPGGVYAVETKGRAKPDKGRGTHDATVVYDGKAIRFPDWFETTPLDQAKRQADWMQKWLTSAVGEPVQVKPVLALPGWFVERTKPGGVLVFNGKNPEFLAKSRSPDSMLTPTLMQRITHQIEQRCRDVEPIAYRKTK